MSDDMLLQFSTILNRVRQDLVLSSESIISTNRQNLGFAFKL